MILRWSSVEHSSRTSVTYSKSAILFEVITVFAFVLTKSSSGGRSVLPLLVSIALILTVSPLMCLANVL